MCPCCFSGEEPESQLHSHGSVHTSRLSAGQGGGAQFHAQTQGTRVNLCSLYNLLVLYQFMMSHHFI